MSSQTIYAGKSVTSTTERLRKVSIEYIYHSLTNPKESLETAVRTLRIVRNVDRKRYAALKRSLPYLVCGTFNPPFRKKENFAFTEYFIIDIDNLSQKSLNPETLKRRLVQDERVLLAFVSPGNDGLKLLFKLDERCYDAGKYSLFYKLFVRRFSELYHLDQLVDPCTSDVSRACFMSVDPQAYYNPDATSVRMADFVDFENPLEAFNLKSLEEKKEKQEKTKVKEQQSAEDGPDEEAIQHIKEILKVRNVKVKEKQIFVPQQLNEIIDDLKKYILDTGIVVTEVTNINYGKKIKMQVGRLVSEINLFFGKRGYTVVISPRSGTAPDLNQTCADLINSFFTTNVIGE